jgi:hypothetical protein
VAAVTAGDGTSVFVQVFSRIGSEFFSIISFAAQVHFQHHTYNVIVFMNSCIKPVLPSLSRTAR